MAETTPPTRISVGVTPVSFTATCEPSGEPDVEGEVLSAVLVGLLPQEAASSANATSAASHEP